MRKGKYSDKGEIHYNYYYIRGIIQTKIIDWKKIEQFIESTDEMNYFKSSINQ